MRRLFTLFSISLLLVYSASYSQTKNPANTKGKSCPNSPKINWSSRDKMPGAIPAFEENKGQFPPSTSGWKILYGCNYNGVDIYLTDKGIIYNIAKADKDSAESEIGDNDPDKNPDKKTTVHYQHIFINWENASVNPRIEAEGETPYYFSQGMSGNNYKQTITNIKGFQKIVYHDLYPGVDLEFTFHEGKGIEYSIKAKPGFDASVFKMKYSGDLGLFFDDLHNLHIGTLQGDIIDHAPKVTSGGVEIPSSFEKTGRDEISFNFQHSTSNISKQTIIDPWTVFPISPATYACDIAIDNTDNTYVLEYSSGIIMYVQKYDITGALVWTYTLHEFTNTPYNTIEVDSSSCSAGYFTDFAVDPNGNSYINSTWGFRNLYNSTTFGMVSLNALGQRNYLNYTYSADSISEPWVVTYSCADSLLVEAGCLVCCDKAQFDGVNAATGNPNPGEYTNLNIGEIYTGTIAPNGYFYAMSAIPHDNMSGPDILLCANITKTSATLLWQLNVLYPDNDFNMRETPQQLSTNGIVASCSYLYTSDGLTLDQRDLTTGAIINTATIPNGNNAFTTCTSGLAIDLGCGNVYAGSDSGIYVYDQNLNPIGSFTGLPGKVYDVSCNNGLVSACGYNNIYGTSFVVQVNALTCSSGITTTHTNASCTGNIGTASATATFCSGPYNYLWSPGGQTTQTISGLSAGVYTVTVSPHGTCISASDTVIVGGPAALVSATAANCSRDSSGSATVTITGGNPPFTYLWSNGSTNQMDTGLAVGKYYITVTDSAGCVFYDSVTITNGTPTIISVVPAPDSICSGSNIVITASGGKTYTWTPNYGLNCYTCPNPTATPTATTTYTVTALDSNGCTSTASAKINVYTLPRPLITGKDSVCAGYSDTLSTTGGTTYIWSNGATTTSIITSIATNETFTVTAYNGVCSHDTTFTIHVIPTPTAVAIALPDTVCSGDSVLLTASGGTTYLWSTGKTSSGIWVTPGSSTTYTLQAFAGTCSNSTTVTVNIAPVTTATVSPNDTICPHGSSTITATGTGGNITYKWSNGATSSSITVSDSVNTTYSVTVFGKCDSVKKIVTEIVEPLAKPIITGTSQICPGTKDTLHVSGGNSYRWGNGNTTATYITGSLNVDSMADVVAYNSLGCPDTTHFFISIITQTVTVEPASVCQGECVTLRAITGGGTTYNWSNGATTDTTTVCDTATTTYSVTIKNVCTYERFATVTVYSPSLYACCDTTIITGESATLIAASSTTPTWTPKTGLNCDTCTTVIATPTVTTTYTVTGTDSHGCTDSRIITVIVDKACFNFTVPNVITPNNPGPNDVNNEFYIKTDNITNWSITIYDRWGKEVFKTNNPDVYWTGTTPNGAEAPDGVYYYILSGTCQNNTYKIDGFVQLIR